MSLYAIYSIDQDHCRIHNLDCPLHLPRKICMAWRINPVKSIPLKGKYRLFGKYSDPPFSLNWLIIQKSVFMIYSSPAADRMSVKKHLLRKSGFPRIHVGQYSNNTFHFFFPLSFNFIFFLGTSLSISFSSNRRGSPSPAASICSSPILCLFKRLETASLNRQ